MNVKKLEPGQLTRQEFAQFAQTERAGRASFASMDQLLRKMEKQETYACFVGERLAAYIVIERNHPYFAGSLHIMELKPNWMFFTEEVLLCLIRESVALCARRSGESSVTVDVHRQHDVLCEFYRHAGFKPTLQSSSVDEDHIVYAASVAAYVK